MTGGPSIGPPVITVKQRGEGPGVQGAGPQSVERPIQGPFRL
jgi:hypothetical protein